MAAVKSGGPLRRKTPLRADPAKTRDWERRSRRALPATSATRRARGDEMDIPAKVRRAVMKRAAGRCEALLPDCRGVEGLHVHHRLRRSQGGPHTEENLVVLCSGPGACHDYVHAHPSWAYEAGLLIRSHQGPPAEPWDRTSLRSVPNG